MISEPFWPSFPRSDAICTSVAPALMSLWCVPLRLSCLSVFLCLSVTVCLSILLSVCVFRSLWLLVGVSLCVFFTVWLCVSVCLSVFYSLTVCLFRAVWVSLCPSPLSLSLSLSLSLFLSLVSELNSLFFYRVSTLVLTKTYIERLRMNKGRAHITLNARYDCFLSFF